MIDAFNFADELGPAKIIHVYEPSMSLKATLVVDNIARGPAIGGLRMAADVSTEECFRLARAMTLKNAAADLPHGGGKSVLYGDPKMPKADKEKLIRAFACALRNEDGYIFGPDMGLNEEAMAWIKDEIDRAVGLPREIGGIPLDEIGATGWGISHAAEVAARHCGLTLSGARVVIQGFGAVGKHAARFLAQQGAILVAAADSQGAVYDAEGLDIASLCKLKEEGQSITAYPKGQHLNKEAVIDIACEIWIPAARPDVINEQNVARLQTKLIVQGANIPVTHAAEKILHQRGVLCLPDFIANAGGVICAAMEYQKAPEITALQVIAEKLRHNTEYILQTMRKEQISPREAALRLAISRIKKAMNYKRWSIF
jgi:glutamate dehydrogenase (NAD(P)+)